MEQGKIKISKLAICGFVLGLGFPLTMFLTADRTYVVGPWENAGRGFVYLFLIPVTAVVLGHLGRRQVRRKTEGLKGSNLGATGFLLGYLGLASLPFLAAWNRGPRGAGHLEPMAVASLRSINAATHAYADSHPKQGFAASLEEMSCTGASKTDLWCIDPALASGEKAGYRLTYIRGDKLAGGRLETYEILADPVKISPYSKRRFLTDQTGVIRYTEDGGRPNAQSKPL